MRVMIILCCAFGWHIKQLDIKTAFLYGKRKKNIYLRLPLGHRKRRPGYVWTTNTSVYGLRDAPLVWYLLLHKKLVDFGLERCPMETCLYKMKELYVVVYVDDILYFGPNLKVIEKFEVYLKEFFKIKSTKDVRKYVGFQFMPLERKMIVTSHINAALKRCRLEEVKEKEFPATYGEIFEDTVKNKLADVRLFQSIVGSLHYINTIGRPDVGFIVNYLARRAKEPTQHDLKVAKKVFAYLKKSKNSGIKIEDLKDKELHLNAYSDSDFAGDKADRRSVSGYIIKLNDTVLDYKSKKQSIVALSTFEAELVALVETTKQTLYLKRLL